MADPHIITTLRAKQVELQDVVSYLEGKIAEAQLDLGHVNAVLRLYEIDGTALQFPADVNISRLFKRGDLVRAIPTPETPSSTEMSFKRKRPPTEAALPFPAQTVPRGFSRIRIILC